MPINRGPFNALVDDDGSNTIGTPWNKQAIKDVLLDPIDAQFPLFQVVPFSAGNFAGFNNMVWTVGASAVVENRYAVIGGHVMIWSFNVSTYSGASVLSGTPAQGLQIAIPGGKVAASATRLVMPYTFGIGGVNTLAGLQVLPTGGVIQIYKPDGVTNFALSDTPGLIGTFIFEVQ